MSKNQSVTGKENFFKRTFGSLTQLKETKVLTICGLMGALAIILGQVATIKFGQYVRIGFSGLPNQIVD